MYINVKQNSTLYLYTADHFVQWVPSDWTIINAHNLFYINNTEPLYIILLYYRSNMVISMDINLQLIDLLANENKNINSCRQWGVTITVNSLHSNGKISMTSYTIFLYNIFNILKINNMFIKYTTSIITKITTKPFHFKLNNSYLK